MAALEEQESQIEPLLHITPEVASPFGIETKGHGHNFEDPSEVSQEDFEGISVVEETQYELTELDTQPPPDYVKPFNDGTSGMNHPPFADGQSIATRSPFIAKIKLPILETAAFKFQVAPKRDAGKYNNAALRNIEVGHHGPGLGLSNSLEPQTKSECTLMLMIVSNA